jgi:methionyl-tRNA synthetase
LEKGFAPEHLRFYFAKNLSKKMSDINLDFKDFQKSVNNELVGNVGNFSYRVLSFLEKNFDSEVTSIDEDPIIDELKAKAEQVKKHYNNINLSEAVKIIMEISSIGNKYFQENEPWKLVKEDKAKAASILGLCVNIVRNLSILMQPITPLFAGELWSVLGEKNLKFKDINFSYKGKVGKALILFKKIEDDAIKGLAAPGKKEAEKFLLDLKIAEIKKAKDHPDAEKLTILEINVGEKKPRQIVAGIREHYKSEDLIGKKIVIVANLKPAKLRGYESNGMLLAAVEEGNVELIIPKGKPGDKVYLEGIENNKEQISFEHFQKIKMGIEDKKVLVKDKFLRTKEDFVIVEKAKTGAKVQ